LCFLTRPEPGQVLLNLQMHEEGELMRVQINRGQLAGLVSEGARFLASEVRG
jgi:hypothetical protein